MEATPRGLMDLFFGTLIACLGLGYVWAHRGVLPARWHVALLVGSIVSGLLVPEVLRLCGEAGESTNGWVGFAYVLPMGLVFAGGGVLAPGIGVRAAIKRAGEPPWVDPKEAEVPRAHTAISHGHLFLYLGIAGASL